MNDVKYTVKTTGQFRKDYKPAIRRGQKTELLDQVITMLAQRRNTSSGKYRDHALTGNWTGHRECHVQSDWLLVYRIENDILVLTLTRPGTHSY